MNIFQELCSKEENLDGLKRKKSDYTCFHMKPTEMTIVVNIGVYK